MASFRPKCAGFQSADDHEGSGYPDGVTVHELSRQDARRIAVRAQLLDAAPADGGRPTDLLETVRHLTLLQDDPTKAVAPNAGLVVWSRLGSGCPRDAVPEAVDELALIDLRGMLRPPEDLALYRAELNEWPGRAWPRQVDWLEANDGFRRDLLAELRRDGPLTRHELPDTCVVPWQSSGWNNNRNLAMMLELLVLRGEIAAAGRRGRDRLWDLAERVYPDEPPVPADQARRLRNERRLRALGIARASAPECMVEPDDVGEAGEPAVIDGVRGEWRVDPAYLGGEFRGRVAILSPLDRLIFDRKRLVDLFEFDYQLEMYKPAAKRRWGYWAIPILYGDRLVGKIDATTDRKLGVLRVDAIHQDARFGRLMTANVYRELTDLADWLGVDLALPD